MEEIGRWVECDCGKRAYQRTASLVYICGCGLRYGIVGGVVVEFGLRGDAGRIGRARKEGD